MKVMLELIGIYSAIITRDKFNLFQRSVVSKYRAVRHHHSQEAFIEETFIRGILDSRPEDKDKVLSLLALLFYNSNTYNINYLTLKHILGEVFSERITMRSISHILFIVDERETLEFEELVREFKNIKLLIETSEIWLNLHDIRESRSSKYDPIIMLFISKVRRLTQIIMPGFKDEGSDGMFSAIWAASTISPENQQIVSNLQIEQEVLEFISNYRPLLNQIKAQKIRNYNDLLVPLFRSCYVFLFTFIYDCPENKAKVHGLIKENYLRTYFQDLGPIEFGETVLIIEFLKNNYEECIEFFNRNSESLQKKFKYTFMHSQLLLTMMKFYDEPIQVNLRKFFISIFDFTSYKNFIWLRPDERELNLDLALLRRDGTEPFFYHVNALETLIQVVTHVEESRNSIRNHIRKSLSQQYLYQLLDLDDYYTKDSSNKPILKVVILLKNKVMRLLELTYFSEEVRQDALVFSELKKQNEFLNKLIEEAPARKENENFKRIIIMKNEEEEGPEDRRIESLFLSISKYNGHSEHLLEIKLDSILRFCRAYQKAIQNT